jgi:hypothetical protein
MIHYGEIKAVEELDKKLDNFEIVHSPFNMELTLGEFYLIQESIKCYLKSIKDDYENEQYDKMKDSEL